MIYEGEVLDKHYTKMNMDGDMMMISSAKK